jgi:DNA polymerase-1
MIRALFLPDEGKMWGSFDYSQQEPRLVAHYAQSVNEGIGLPGAEEIIKNYAEHDLDFHSTVAEMTGIPRDQAKTISLGLFYGMGINKLRGELGIDEEEARNVLAQYNAKVPFVKILSQRVTDKASDDGEITTILGRRCRFPFWEARDFNTNFASRSKPLTFEEAKKKYAMDSEGRTWLNKIKRAYTYRAFNRLIQGSAADQTKKAMVDLYNETGFIPHIQVHDELNLSVANQEDAVKVKDVMEQCMDGILVVPSKVDYALGKNWAECK